MISKDFAKRILKRAPFLIPLVDPVRLIIHPREQTAVWKDFYAMRRSMAFLRNHRSLAIRKKTVLIVLASDMAYEAKVLAMLGFGLRMQGFRVVVFMSRICLWARRYFNMFGIHEFVYWEEMELMYQDQQTIALGAQRFLSQPITFQSVKQWKYRNAWIGPQILSSISRRMMQGSPDVADPLVQRYFVELLPETLKMVHIAEQVLQRLKPEFILLNEANYALMGALVDTAIAKNISVIQAVQPSRDDALIFKRLTAQTRRVHPASVASETMEELKKLVWTDEYEASLTAEFQNRYGGKWFLQRRNQPGVKKKTKEEIIKQLAFDPSKKIAVIFSPVLWDANLFYGEDLFEDFGDWFVQTIQAACKNPHVNWIVKLHPANLWKLAREKVMQELAEVTLIREKIGPLPTHVKLLFPNTDISTWSLFELTDYGVTVRGTVGMELPCLGKPVFTAGTGRYSGLGFTIDSSTPGDYLRKLATIQTFGSLSQGQTLLAKKHAYAVFLLRPWAMKSFRAVFNYKKRGVHALDHNLFLAVSSLEEIRKNGDLEKLAKWATESKNVDYLENINF